jgi:photosystem II stability/assembly factor-like uncharacterized protein
MRTSALICLFTVALHGQPYLLDALRWRAIGPNRGGRSQAVAGSARRPLEYYFGATGGGLWKTTNGGTSWVPVTDGQIHSSSVGAVAVAPSNPDIVYLGMGETELRGNIMQGDGVYRTSDAGKTWHHLGLADTQAISRIVVDPADPDRVWVAALGHPFGRNPERGVFRSTDGGATWKRVLLRDDRSGAVDLVLDPHNPRVLFAALWDVYRTPWLLSSGGPGSGLFQSKDGGDTWTEITRRPGLPQGIVGKIGISVSGADSNRVYALVEAEDGGLFQSSDGGATWARVTEDRKIRQRAFYFSRILADPRDRDTIYAMNVEFYRSTDAGQNFVPVRTPHPDHHDLWIAPDNPARMISANDGGAAVSTDHGATWTAENYPTAQLYHVAVTHEFPYHVCGAKQDDGTACVPSQPSPNLHDPYAPPGDWFYSAGGGEAGYVAPDPANPDIFFAGDQAGMITRYDRRTGESRYVNVYPLFFSGMPASALKERWQWTFPIVFSPVDPKLLFTSSQRLWKTADAGQTWEPVSPDLTRHAPETLGDSGGPITKDQNGPEIYGTIFTIAPSRRDAGTIWTGSDDGLVHLTRDGGAHWTNVTPSELGDSTRISLIDASPHKPGGAYLAGKRYQLDDRRPLIFKTADYGTTWTRIVTGIPNDDFVHAVREDPVRAGLLFAGTEHGIYLSFDDGGHWQSLRLNLPDTQVADLVIERDDLVIATHGRGFYILDHIGALRQLTPDILQSNVRLLDPAAAMRNFGPALIDYYVAVTDSGPIGIRVMDAAGKTIRDLPVPAADRTPGLHRVRWDLRYPGAVGFPGMIYRGGTLGVGPVAPPGEYTIVLTAGGDTHLQTLRVQRDPRLAGITDADLAEQFRFALEIRDRLSETNRAVVRIRAVRGELESRRAQLADLAAEIQSLTARLTRIEEDLYQTRNRSPRDTLNYPIKLNNQLAVLEQWVETGDARPTEPEYAVFRELSATLGEILRQLSQILTTDLAHLNEKLAARNLPPVRPM